METGLNIPRTVFSLRLLPVIVAALLLFAHTSEAGVKAVFYPSEPRQGELASLKVTGMKAAGGEKATAIFMDRQFPLIANGKGEFEGFIAADRDAKAGKRELKIVRGMGSGGEPVITVKVGVGSKKFVEQHLKVDEKMVKLSPEDEARAARERVLINAAIGSRSDLDPVAKGYARPVKGEVSGVFGSRRFYNGRAGSYHGGLDIAAPRGEPVYASGEGRVVLTGDFFFTGNTVFVDHGGGLVTGYFHLDELSVKEGTSLTAGDRLGIVGSTGRSTGPHLHWSVYLCGVKVDPESLLAATAALNGGKIN